MGRRARRVVAAGVGRVCPGSRRRPIDSVHERARATIGEEDMWANVIETECIARVDPRSGAVVGWVDMDGAAGRADPGAPTKAA